MANRAEVESKLKDMRRKALAAAIRNVNLHHFQGKANARRMAEYVAERLGVYPTDVKNWLVSDGVPERHVEPLLAVLNEHSVWGRHQLFPSKKLAEGYLEVSNA